MLIAGPDRLDQAVVAAETDVTPAQVAHVRALLYRAEDLVPDNLAALLRVVVALWRGQSRALWSKESQQLAHRYGGRYGVAMTMVEQARESGSWNRIAAVLRIDTEVWAPRGGPSPMGCAPWWLNARA